MPSHCDPRDFTQSLFAAALDRVNPAWYQPSPAAHKEAADAAAAAGAAAAAALPLQEAGGSGTGANPAVVNSNGNISSSDGVNHGASQLGGPGPGATASEADGILATVTAAAVAYCLHCLYETQLQRPRVRVYLPAPLVELLALALPRLPAIGVRITCTWLCLIDAWSWRLCKIRDIA